MIDKEGGFYAWDVDNVKRVAAELRKFPFELLEANFDADAMNEADVYPGVWDTDELEYLRDSYTILVSFFEQVAAEGNAALMEFNI